jgi:rubrerythrin
VIFVSWRRARSISTPDEIREALKHAIQFEHATIPAYLFALFSIEADWELHGAPAGARPNAAVADILHSVVLEEMSHMATACNVLTAIGGEPSLDRPGFIPTYPFKLPHTARRSFEVPLQKFSKALVRDVFMTIEEPEPRPDPSPGAPHFTVGEFYHGIMHAIEECGEELFATPDVDRQVTTTFLATDLRPVTDVASARAAIERVVEEGEGTARNELGPEGEIAHYYRFEAIVRGSIWDPLARRRVPLECDEERVANVVSRAWDDRDPCARVANDAFNYTYTSLLRALEAAFCGRQEKLPAALGLMASLKQQALDMMTGITVDGDAHPGPSFSYSPLPPEPARG